MRKLKIVKDEKIQEGEIVEREWDIKKLAIGLVIVMLLVIVGSYIFFPSGETQSTLGISAENLSPTPALPDEEDVRGVLNNAQETLSKITSDNLISSQAAIQKVINDLETLKGKNGALDLMCNMVCEK